MVLHFVTQYQIITQLFICCIVNIQQDTANVKVRLWLVQTKGMLSLLFTSCSSTCCLDKAKKCGLPSIQPFAEGELSMGWMPLQFAAVLLFG